jgi:outer membrane protein assembly factor BamB
MPRCSLRSLSFGVVFAVAMMMSLPAFAQQERLPPIHPDTLPTLIEAWSLPASLAPKVTNSYGPRLSLWGPHLYVYDHHGRRLVAIRWQTGKVDWHKPVPTRSDVAFSFAPFVHRGRVYVASDGYLHCFSQKSGQTRWKIQTRGTAINGMARSKQHLYLPFLKVEKGHGVRGIQVWAIDSRRGRVEWTRKFPGALGHVVGNSDGPIFIADTGEIFGLTADRGEPRWKARVKGRVSTPPVLKKNILYITTTRRKVGWEGTGLFALDAKTGKLLWKKTLSSTLISRFLARGKLATVDGSGKLTIFDPKGTEELTLKLRFDDPPESLVAQIAGNRIYVFTHHEDGNGYVYLVDIKRKRVIAKANALDESARSLVPAGRLIFLDSNRGTVHAYRLDKSKRPRRNAVPEAEFATELIARAADAKRPQPGLAIKLAGLGQKAIVPINAGLSSTNPFVVEACAKAAAELSSRKSVPALLTALEAQRHQKPLPTLDAVLAVVDALARIRDGSAAKALTGLMEDDTQTHMRRRAAYVALGAIGTPAALAPIWRYRAAKALNTTTFQPLPHTTSYAHFVEKDVLGTDEDVIKATTLRAKSPDGRELTLSLSPFLGGYNDVWVGESDGQGHLTRPFFTGFTKPEIKANQRIRLDQLKVSLHTPKVDRQNKKKKGGKDGSGKDASGKISKKASAAKADDMPSPYDPPQAVSAAAGTNFAEMNPDILLKRTSVKFRVRIKHRGRWVKAKPIKLSFRALMADRDKDGLPDIVERRLQLCVTHPDCDGDGIKDSEDVNPLASGNLKLTEEQKVFREAFFAYFSFLKRRGIVVVDPGNGPSFELYGRQDPILSLRRSTIAQLRKKVGLHGIDYVSFGGPYPAGAGSGDALKTVQWGKKQKTAVVGMDIVRSGDNAVAYNVKLRKKGRNWVVIEMTRMWTTRKAGDASAAADRLAPSPTLAPRASTKTAPTATSLKRADGKSLPVRMKKPAVKKPAVKNRL